MFYFHLLHSLTQIVSGISSHRNKANTIPRFLASFTQRLNLCVSPLDAQIVPILRLVLAPILLLHGL